MVIKRPAPYYIRVLQQELKRRKAKNSRYSLRAFAQFLEMHPSALSRVLNGKQELSISSCAITLRKLRLPENEARIFIASISNDKRNRSLAMLTKAIEPAFAQRAKDFDPRFETIVAAEPPLLKDGFTVLALSDELNSVMDLEGKFLNADEALAHELETIPCNLIGLTWRETSIAPEVAEELERQQASVVANPDVSRFEFSVGEGADRIDYERKIVPILGKDGTFRAYVSSIKNVTWPKFQLESTIRLHSSPRLETILKGLGEIGVPRLANASLVFLSDGKGIALKSVVARVPADSIILRRNAAQVLKGAKASDALNSGKPVIGELDSANGYGTTEEFQSYAVLPIGSRSHKGAVVLLSNARSRFGDWDVSTSLRILTQAGNSALSLSEDCEQAFAKG